MMAPMAQGPKLGQAPAAMADMLRLHLAECWPHYRGRRRAVVAPTDMDGKMLLTMWLWREVEKTEARIDRGVQLIESLKGVDLRDKFPVYMSNWCRLVQRAEALRTRLLAIDTPLRRQYLTHYRQQVETRGEQITAEIAALIAQVGQQTLFGDDPITYRAEPRPPRRGAHNAHKRHSVASGAIV